MNKILLTYNLFQIVVSLGGEVCNLRGQVEEFSMRLKEAQDALKVFVRPLKAWTAVNYWTCAKALNKIMVRLSAVLKGS